MFLITPFRGVFLFYGYNHTIKVSWQIVLCVNTIMNRHVHSLRLRTEQPKRLILVCTVLCPLYFLMYIPFGVSLDYCHKLLSLSLYKGIWLLSKKELWLGQNYFYSHRSKTNMYLIFIKKGTVLRSRIAW